jgi:hypothetical protein
MSNRDEPDHEAMPYVPWNIIGHPYQVVPTFGPPKERWASSADRARAEVAEARTFKLKNSEGDLYLFTPSPFDRLVVWVRNKGEKKELSTYDARKLWRDLIQNGYRKVS